jgi:hypothetical protein
LLIYLAVCLGVLRMRRLRAATPAAFRTPGGPGVPLVGVAAILWLLSHSTAAEVASIITLLAAATAYYLIRRRSMSAWTPVSSIF